jgi:hypothetical protein
MNKIMKITGYGFVMWLIPFIISLLIYPIKISLNPLFETIMPVVITLTVVLLTISYLKHIKKNFLRESMVIGVSWFLISIIIDLILFLPASPMHMSLANYMMDIGLTYLIIPFVTVGMGYMVDKYNIN